jgi:hypothetical protein
MNAQLTGQDETIADYGNCPDQLEAAIIGLSETNLDIGQSADSWTIRKIIHHIVDGDDIWKAFIKQAIGNQGGEFLLDWYWQIPQDEWAKRWDYQARSIEPSLLMFRANRGHIVQLLKHTPEAMERSLRIHWPEGGEQDISVGWVVEMQTQHVIDHVAEINKIRKTHGV